MHNKNIPISVETAPVKCGGEKGKRLMVTLYAPGCGYSRKTGGCSFCGFKELSSKGEPVSAEDLISQFKHALSPASVRSISEIIEIDVYNSGSFLNPSEIPSDAQEEILKTASGVESVKEIMIESRPEYILRHPEQLFLLKKIAGEKTLEIGMGLETRDDRVRRDILKKGIDIADFEAAVKIIKDAGCDILVYVLFKPPYLSAEESVKDAVETIKYLHNLSHDIGVRIKVALQPVFVAKGTLLEELYLKGSYTPPTLWNVIDVIEGAGNILEIQVALSDEGLSGGRYASNCPQCDRKVRAALRDYNEDGSLAHFKNLSCPCKK